MQATNFLTSFYSRITSTKSPSFCITTFRASFTNLMALIPQSRDSSYYVSRPILAPPPLRLQKHIDLRAHDSEHFPHLWHQPRFVNITYVWSWRLCGITPAITTKTAYHGLSHKGSFSNQPLCFLCSGRSWFRLNEGVEQKCLYKRPYVLTPVDT